MKASSFTKTQTIDYLQGYYDVTMKFSRQTAGGGEELSESGPYHLYHITIQNEKRLAPDLIE